MDDDLLRLLRGIIERLESKAEADGDQTGDEVALREQLLALELSAKLKARPTPKPGIDWGKHLPLLLTGAVIIAAIVAALLGVDIKGML